MPNKNAKWHDRPLMEFSFNRYGRALSDAAKFFILGGNEVTNLTIALPDA
jgi:hypothetical protein